MHVGTGRYLGFVLHLTGHIDHQVGVIRLCISPALHFFTDGITENGTVDAGVVGVFSPHGIEETIGLVPGKVDAGV